MRPSQNRDSQPAREPPNASAAAIELFRQGANPFQGPRRFRLDERECLLDRWLSEFEGKTTGCTSPPPMS